jgi:excisionase family DNA binding protein
MSGTEILVQEIAAAVADKLSGTMAGSTLPRLLSINLAAEYLGCSIGHIKNLVAAGTLPTVRWQEEGVRNKHYFDRQDLDKAIEQHKR